MAAAAATERIRAEIFERERSKLRQEQYAQLKGRLSTIHYLTGRDFEHYLAEVLRFAGYTVTVTQESCDQGVDLIAIGQSGKRLAIQATNHKAPVGNSGVRELYTGIACHDCHFGAVIARSGFTRSAEKAAAKTRVHLWTLVEVERFLADGMWFKL